MGRPIKGVCVSVAGAAPDVSWTLVWTLDLVYFMHLHKSTPIHIPQPTYYNKRNQYPYRFNVSPKGGNCAICGFPPRDEGHLDLITLLRGGGGTWI